MATLKEELGRRESQPGLDYAGVPPVGQYWLIVEHGHELAELLTVNKWSYRRLSARFSVAPDTVKRAALFISDHEEIVATKDWRKLEDLLFSRWPDFRTMDFYRAYIATGSSAAYRKNFKEGKKLGRRLGSKNKPKVPAAAVPEGRGGSPLLQPPQGHQSPATPPAPISPAPPPPVPAPVSAGDTDIELPEAWSSRRAREMAAKRPGEQA